MLILGRILKSGTISKLNGLFSTDGYSLVELIVVIIIGTVAMPAIVDMYTTVLTKSHSAEIMSVSEFLAAEQIEIILADKAGTGAGYGYVAIDDAKYASVNPTGNFAAYTRTVDITDANLPGGPYPYKRVTVTVDHLLTPPVTLTTMILDHSGI